MECPKISKECDVCYSLDMLKDKKRIDEIVQHIQKDLEAELRDNRLKGDYNDMIKQCRLCYTSRIRKADKDFCSEFNIKPPYK